MKDLTQISSRTHNIISGTHPMPSKPGGRCIDRLLSITWHLQSRRAIYMYAQLL